MLDTGQALVFWDTDKYFLENNYHEAGKFIREYRDKWNFYQNNKLNLIGTSFNSEKNIHLHSVVGNIATVQKAANILKEIPADEIEQTAVILADESLLTPLLSVIPESIEHVNVTLSLPLENLPAASFFKNLIHLLQSDNERGFYYKDLLRVVESSFAPFLFPEHREKITRYIKRKNLIYVNMDELATELQIDDFLFTSAIKADSPAKLVDIIQELHQYL